MKKSRISCVFYAVREAFAKTPAVVKTRVQLE